MKKRYINLDLIRTVAIILIISNHVLSAIYVHSSYYATWQSSDMFEKSFILINYIISRLGVPLFLFLTGALILNKKFDDKSDVKKFYKKNLVPLLIAVCSWNIIYYLFNIWYYGSSFSWKGLIYRVLFMKSSAMPHMWYMPMIIGMYIFLPFISIIVKKFNFKDLILPITIVTIASFILPNIKLFLNFFGYAAKDCNLILNLSYGGGYMAFI